MITSVLKDFSNIAEEIFIKNIIKKNLKRFILKSEEFNILIFFFCINKIIDKKNEEKPKKNPFRMSINKPRIKI